jgi:phosphosulfolactate synthase (CoM biosynthesis protein A)
MLTPLRLCRKSAASFNHATGSITRCFASLPGGNFEDGQPAFEFVRQNLLTTKPRTTGLTEMRGPYYTPMGPRYLRDILEGISHAVDSIKFAGGSFAILRRKTVKELIDIAHEHGVSVSTGGWVEHVIPQGRETVQRYFTECKNLGFDTVELSTGFISVPTQDLVRMVHDAQNVSFSWIAPLKGPLKCQ